LASSDGSHDKGIFHDFICERAGQLNLISQKARNIRRQPRHNLTRASKLGAGACLLIASLTSVGAPAGAHATSYDLIIRNARVFDGERVRERASVAVRNGTIVRMVNGDLKAKARQVIDGRGATLLPGLIDAHVHVAPDAQADALRFGVTTELDMFDTEKKFVAWRTQRSGRRPALEADTFAAGTPVTVPGGAPFQDMTEEGAPPTLGPTDDPRKFVNARIDEGSDYIKIFLDTLEEFGTSARLPTLSRDQVCALVVAAHDRGKLVIAHAQSRAQADKAVSCGVDGLAHMLPDALLDDDFATTLKARHIFMITTESVWAGIAGSGRAARMRDDPRVGPFLSADQCRALKLNLPRSFPAFFSTATKNVALMHDHGVMLLAGSDAPNFATAHGISLHEEMQLLVEAGLSPLESLRSATSAPARAFRLTDRGRIAKGYRADLLLVDGDPTRQISDSLSIRQIWKNGFAVSRQKIGCGSSANS
jgi:imidazolonepropionase-like amidohydrolase